MRGSNEISNSLGLGAGRENYLQTLQPAASLDRLNQFTYGSRKSYSQKQDLLPADKLSRTLDFQFGNGSTTGSKKTQQIATGLSILPIFKLEERQEDAHENVEEVLAENADKLRKLDQDTRKKLSKGLQMYSKKQKEEEDERVWQERQTLKKQRMEEFHQDVHSTFQRFKSEDKLKTHPAQFKPVYWQPAPRPVIRTRVCQDVDLYYPYLPVTPIGPCCPSYYPYRSYGEYRYPSLFYNRRPLPCCVCPVHSNRCPYCYY